MSTYTTTQPIAQTQPIAHPEDSPTAPDQATDPSRRARRRSPRNKAGLTTLEWLLIVAAVAGLAALAVVLVQNVVDDTAEQLGGASARATAANVAADTVIREARTADVNDHRFNTWQRWELYFTARCERLEILYSDTNLDVDATFKRPANKNPGDPTDTTALTNADKDDPGTNKPQAKCERRSS